MKKISPGQNGSEVGLRYRGYVHSTYASGRESKEVKKLRTGKTGGMFNIEIQLRSTNLNILRDLVYQLSFYRNFGGHTLSMTASFLAFFYPLPPLTAK